MNISDFFPFWEELTPYQQKLLISSAVKRTVKKGTVIHNGSSDCLGLLLVSSGQLRAYILSQEGREITDISPVRQGYLHVFRLLHASQSAI